MDFPKILKQLRKKKGIKQSTLGAVLNLSVSAISNYESGVNYPDYVTLCAIADYFEVSVDFLLRRTDYPHSDKLLKQRISGKYTMNDLLKCLCCMPKELVDSIANSIMILKHQLQLVKDIFITFARFCPVSHALDRGE